MRFHPVISIILGLIGYWLSGAIIILTGLQGISGLFYGLSYLFGGFLAVYLAREKKLRYGIYEGICICLYIIIGTILFGGWSNINYEIVGRVFIIIFAGVGGILAIKLDNT